MPHFADVDWDKALAWLDTHTGTDLAHEQEQAVRLPLTSKVAVLTGGPGCGKSFTVRSIVTRAAAKKADVGCGRHVQVVEVEHVPDRSPSDPDPWIGMQHGVA